MVIMSTQTEWRTIEQLQLNIAVFCLNICLILCMHTYSYVNDLLCKQATIHLYIARVIFCCVVIIFDVGDVLVLYKYRFINMNVNLAHIYYCI